MRGKKNGWGGGGRGAAGEGRRARGIITVVAIKQGLTDSHSFCVSACVRGGQCASETFCSDRASTRCPRSGQVPGTPRRWVCHEMSVFLIHSETRLRKAAKPHIRTFGGFFCLFNCFSSPSSSSVLSPFLSKDGLIFLPSAGSLLLLLLPPSLQPDIIAERRSGFRGPRCQCTAGRREASPCKVPKARKFCWFDASRLVLISL